MSTSFTRAPRVLVVGDEAETVDTVHAALRHAGFEVKACLSPRDARRAAAAYAPDVVVTDVFMADGDTVELGLWLRWTCPGVPFIAVLGDDAHPTETYGIDPGRQLELLRARCVFRKPFDLADLGELTDAVYGLFDETIAAAG